MAALPDILSALLPVGCLVLLRLYGNRGDANGRSRNLRLFFAFVAGAFAVVPPALFQLVIHGIPAFSTDGPGTIISRAVLILAFTAIPEESSRFLFMLPFVKRSNRERDGVSVGIALGLGFAFIENFLFFGDSAGTFFRRGFTSLPLHAACGGLVGLAVSREPRRYAPFFGAVALHGLFDILLLFRNAVSLLAPVAALIALVPVVRRARVDDA